MLNSAMYIMAIRTAATPAAWVQAGLEYALYKRGGVTDAGAAYLALHETVSYALRDCAAAVQDIALWRDALEKLYFPLEAVRSHRRNRPASDQVAKIVHDILQIT